MQTMMKHGTLTSIAVVLTASAISSEYLITHPVNTITITANDIIVEAASPHEKEVLDSTMFTYDNVTHSSSSIIDDDTITESEWESYTFLDMHDHFDCREYAINASKPLYTIDMWKRLWENLAFVNQAEDMPSFTLDETHLENYYSGYTETKGRGTYAMRNFTKGELVHDGTVSTLFWNDGLLWKEYVMSLPDHMACDVLEWTWIQEVKGYGHLLCLNMNDAAFLNHDDDFNIAPKDNTSLEFYAVKGM